MVVIKRNGQETQFNKTKIYNAIFKAMREVEDDDFVLASAIANKIESYASKSQQILNVETIQDMVEDELIKNGDSKVAKAYIKYRYLHNIARNQYKELMDAVSDKLQAKNVVNQNANVDEKSFGGRIGEATDVVTRQYSLDYIISPMARQNHENNEIYIHDLNAYAVGSHNCLSIPFDDLLANGFNTRQTDVRPAQSINTAFQLTAVIFQLQSLQQFGGASATHIDWTMVPYVRKSFAKHLKDGIKYFINEEYANNVPSEVAFDDPEANYKKNAKAYKYAMEMTEKETYQAVEGMYHNLR